MAGQKSTSILRKIQFYTAFIIAAFILIISVNGFMYIRSAKISMMDTRLRDIYIDMLSIQNRTQDLLLTGDRSVVAAIKEYMDDAEGDIAAIKSDLVSGHVDAAFLDPIKPLFDDNRKILDEIERTPAPFDQAFLAAKADEFRTLLPRFDSVTGSLSSLYHQNWAKIANAALLPFIIVSAIIVIALLALSVLIVRSIRAPINDLMKALPNLIRQDGSKVRLDQKIEVRANDELGRISVMVNNLMLQLNNDFGKIFRVLRRLTESKTDLEIATNAEAHEAEVINSYIGSIGQNVEQQTSGVEEVSATLEEMKRNLDTISLSIGRQSTAVEESASTIEEMGRNIENIARVSTQTREISDRLSQVAYQGGETVKESVASIQDVSDYSRQILKLLKLITDIAKQTNLLAMNASIEAAHAGEAGKGFAIVADEIRRLSETTNKNAKEIGDVVNTIIEKIDRSAELSRGAGEGLENIEKFAKESEGAIRQLNLMIEEQNTSIKEILQATESIVAVTEEVKLAMQEQKTGVGEFSDTMNSLKDLFVETKDRINDHISSLSKLTGFIEKTDAIVRDNSSVYAELEALLVNFEFETSMNGDAPEETGIKLVE